MAKILGLDLGTNSIGWAVVDDKNEEILGTGIRIFPEGVVAKTIGTGDREVSKNAARRESRQSRRGFYRHRLRRIKLLEALIEFKMCPLTVEELKQWKKYDKKKGQAGKTFPNSPEFISWLKLNPYQLRAKALNEDISLFELGRIFYHLIQRRGFLSNRKGNEEGKIFSGKDNMTGINETENQIKDKTLGAYLNSVIPKENEPYKNITDESGKELRARGRYTLRDMYVDEFEKIWQRQSEKLGLTSIQKEVKKESIISGSINNKRNKHRIEKLTESKGKQNVKLAGNKLTVTEYISLKEYLAGEIYYDDEGNIKHKSQESVLFYQRPLRSQKGLLAKCSFEGRKFYDKKNKRWRTAGPTPCPLSHPEFEEFRALQFINNIEYGAKKRLDEHQRQMLYDLFNKKDAGFDFKLIPKELKLTYETFNYADDFKAAGNYTNSKLSKLFKADIWEAHKEEIWHCFYFFDDNDKLIEKLKDDFDLSEKDEEKVGKIKLKDGYASVSLKAIRNITPFLKKGYKLSDAVLLGGVRNAFKTTNKENESYDRWKNFNSEHEKIEKDIIHINKDKKNKEGEAIKRIKEYLYENCGFEKDDKNFKKLYHHSQEIEQKKIQDKLDKIENLRNPIVQQGLNELRRVVNTLLKEHGKFDKIKVELGRNLKMGKKQRQETTFRIKENNTKNDEAREKLSEYGLAHSRENVQKYLLWKEIEDRSGTAKCPYTGKTINISDLLGKENKFQIEHIFPRSTSLDDSFGNKTLCEAKFNGLKGNKTPHQFYKENNDAKLWGGAKSWDDIKQRAFKLLPYRKAKRFTAEKVDEKADGFIERQLNDTRYMSKKAKEILSQICPKDDIRVMPGSVTSELRHLWGLNNILQPVEVLDFKGAKINIDKAEKHRVVFDEKGEVLGLYPINNVKPTLKLNEITISGYLNNKGEFSSKYISVKSKHEELTGDSFKGEYWKKLQLSTEPLHIEKMFTDKPEVADDEIVLRGKVAKKYFENDTIGKKIKTEFEDGYYWAKFKVKDIKFEKPVPKKQPKKKVGQILLYGNIEDAIFKSYIFECQTGEADGKYWAIIDLDFNNIEFSNTMNPKPETDDNTILIQGSVNENSLFSSDIDNEHNFETKLSQGKYWTIFEIEKEDAKLYPQINLEPELQEKQKIVEGTVWVDKYTGEIKFDPKKNRDDHRHHAIDAITIALTEQSYLQKLSTYNAQLDDKRRGKGDKPTFEKPWDNFYNDAKKAASEMLISHKANNKVLTKINKVIHKKGRKFTSKGYAAGGQLHKENVYGKRQAPSSEKPYYHIRKTVDSLKDNQVKKIVDERIKKIILKAREQEKIIKKEIEELNKLLKKAKTDFEESDIQKQIEQKQEDIKMLYTLPNKNGEPVPIRKVRIKENLGNMMQLKDKKVFAEKKGEETELNQYVNPRNNHHVAIYKNAEGELFEKVVTFWEAVERKKEGLSVIDKTPKDGSKFITSLEINDMFLLDINPVKVDFDNPNYALLSMFLYRVQKITSGVYTFTHHLESNINVDKYKFNPETEVFPKVLRKSKGSLNGIKVKIDILGRISKVD
ncbi:MAG: type II CRISPR RNA-guided endonuclease Cas9 [Bacteroidales bacterium]|nr:type II CRISPR RNA-guided endonuclease Cas9 [Bacteroidales bacterium]